MQDFMELLKIILPALLVFLTSWYLIREFLRKEESRRIDEQKRLIGKDALMLRMQAYERLILLMERISPAAVVLRLSKNNQTAKDLHLQLIGTVKAEFEHNIAQQLYVSKETWQMVVASKEETVRLFNMSKEKCKENDNAIVLAKIILSDCQPTQDLISKTIDLIKQEAQKLF
ncbi:MAG TPA: hypothetical protein P5050_02830 [Bacteroidia bacterium]|nr:hypothetical protein [Bacteroidia bacterium]HRS58136.1 hypothetical protein [Bacteroidia bacterium]HRU68753.1 hypothetical protein [Bacteroidia bacterium]